MNKRGQPPRGTVPGFWTENSRVRQLLERRGINLGPPTTEELVGLFLREHGQRSTHQGWTHGKQWALAHDDWPAFLDRMMARHTDEEERAHSYINSAEFQNDYNNLLLEEDRRRSRQRSSRLAMLAVMALAAFGTVIGVVVEMADRRTPEPLQEKRI